jgi:hypothetical protein
VEFLCQLTMCSGTKENHGKRCSSRCKLISSQMSVIKYTTITLVPICAVALFKNILKLFLQIFVCACILDKHQSVWNECTHMHKNIHTILSHVIGAVSSSSDKEMDVCGQLFCLYFPVYR